MLIDLRYHLTSLVAVFLALALGIIIGNSLIIGPSIERQIARGLQQEFGKVLAENHDQRVTIQDLQEQAKKQLEFDRAILPILIDNRLQWKRVAIIQTGDYSEATQSARSAIELSGGSVASVTTLSTFESAAALDSAQRAVELVSGEHLEGEAAFDRMLGILANSVVTGSNPAAMTALEAKGLVSGSGHYGLRVARVVIVGGCKQRGSRRAQSIDLPLINKLKEAGALTVVGAEPVRAAISFVPMYHRKGIATVDNIDQPMGQAALIFALLGENGSFGVKLHADKVVPEYLEIGSWRSRFHR
jgi:hypothetical protein